MPDDVQTEQSESLRTVKDPYARARIRALEQRIAELEAEVAQLRGRTHPQES